MVNILLLSFAEEKTALAVRAAVPDWMPVMALHFPACDADEVNKAIFEADMVFLFCTNTVQVDMALRCVAQAGSHYARRGLPVLVVPQDIRLDAAVPIPACVYRLRSDAADDGKTAMELTLLMEAILAGAIRIGLIGVDLEDCYAVLGQQSCRLLVASVQGDKGDPLADRAFQSLAEQMGQLPPDNALKGCIVTYWAGRDVRIDDFEQMAASADRWLSASDATYYVAVPVLPEMAPAQRRLDVVLVY